MTKRNYYVEGEFHCLIIDARSEKDAIKKAVGIFAKDAAARGNVSEKEAKMGHAIEEMSWTASESDNQED